MTSHHAVDGFETLQRMHGVRLRPGDLIRVTYRPTWLTFDAMATVIACKDELGRDRLWCLHLFIHGSIGKHVAVPFSNLIEIQRLGGAE